MSSTMWTKPPTLDDLLGLAAWDTDALDSLIRLQAPESEHIEYKGGDWLASSTDAEATSEIRRYIGGFANAEGGVLVWGLTETNRGTGRRSRNYPTAREPVGFAPAGGLTSWVRQALLQGAVYPALHPAPRVFEFRDATGTGPYLAVVIRPFEQGLVTIRYLGRNTFPARLGDSTVDLDDWAIRAVMHGTRRVPRVALHLVENFDARLAPELSVGTFPNGDTLYELDLFFCVQNDGQIWLSNPTWGMVFPVAVHKVDDGRVVPVSPAIRRDVASDAGEWIHVVRRPMAAAALEPYGTFQLRLTAQFRAPARCEQIKLRFGLYIVGENASPMWYSIEVTKRALTVKVEYGPTETPVQISFEAI